MGRPYQVELSAFPDTYRWALGLNVDEYARAVRRAAEYPLVAIGSGGSLSAAQFCADWHQRATGRLGRTLTPLEAVATHLGRGGLAAAVFSAGGRNADIRRAFASVLAEEPAVSWVITGATGSPLSQAARDSSVAPLVVAHKSPAGRDGFLATNSLLSFVIQTHRAYAAAFPGADLEAGALPEDWTSFAGDGLVLHDVEPAQLGDVTTLVVLHGYTTRAAALDLESKCTEAGLLQVQVADYRNFAHGRHHWLAKHPATAVLALVAPEDLTLAERTLKLLPRTVIQGQLRLRDRGFRGGLRALVDVMRVVGEIGIAKGIDPGRPGVPSYGGKLYSFKGIELVERPGHTVEMDARRGVELTTARHAIERKLRRPFESASLEERRSWLTAYDAACAHLAKQEFKGVVFDYDGTLVDAADRYTGPRTEVLGSLVDLLEQGATLGIATGRGKSAGKELRAALPSAFWGQVLMGYYNSSDIALLAADDAPDRRPTVEERLSSVLEALEASSTVGRHATITPRRQQITLEPHDASTAHDVWDAVEGIVLRLGAAARLVRSSHSIDVLAPGVSKMALVNAVRVHTRSEPHGSVLRVGDRARWPGNDAELLASLDGVSVDEVSSDPVSAWNFAPPGVRGVAATRALLDLLCMRNGHVRLSWSGPNRTVPTPRAKRTASRTGATVSALSRVSE